MQKAEDHIKAITEKLTTLSSITSHSEHNIFNDFIQVVFNTAADPSFIQEALPMCLLEVEKGWRAEPASYAENPDTGELLREIGFHYLSAVKESEPFTDVIGEIIGKYSNRTLKQFLTPKGLADGISAFTQAILLPTTAPFSIGDPTGCGAGSLILAQLRAIYKRDGGEGIKLTSVTATDIDRNMVKACCMQVMMSSALHELPLSSFTARHTDAIKGHNDDATVYKLTNFKTCFDLLMQHQAGFMPISAQASNTVTRKKAA